MGKDYSWHTMIIIIFVVILVWGVVWSFSSDSNNSSFTDTNSVDEVNQVGQIQANFQQKETCRNVQVPYSEQEVYYETVPYTDRVCEDKELVYKQERGTCVGKSDGYLGVGARPMSYSCTITNLDTEAKIFTMKIGLNIGEQQLFDTLSYYIYPQSSKEFAYAEDIGGESCFCVLEEIPTKSVCRDVIKNKEVRKTRTVTKYRTEKQCD